MVDTKIQLKDGTRLTLQGEDLLRGYAVLQEQSVLQKAADLGSSACIDEFLLVGTLVDNANYRTSVLYQLSIWTDHSRSDATRSAIRGVMLKSFIDWIVDRVAEESGLLGIDENEVAWTELHWDSFSLTRL